MVSRADPWATGPRAERGLRFHPVLVFLISFAVLFLLHIPLLRLPYYWDEAGYFVPAARDLLLYGDPIPRDTLSNAHPPLVMVYLALAWKLFGYRIIVTRTAILVVAAAALAGLFQLARRISNTSIAIASLMCTALYPPFFAQSTLANLDLTAAALTFWALFFYFAPGEAASEAQRAERGEGGRRPLAASRGMAIAFFSLAALAKETAILAPLALGLYEAVSWLAERRSESRDSRLAPDRPRRPARILLLLVIPAAPLLLWFCYHHSRTGFFFGNPEYWRYNVETTLRPSRILLALGTRVWQLGFHMNLFVLTISAAVAMWWPPLRDNGTERPRIKGSVQAALAAIIGCYVVVLSLIGGALLARYLLPVVPLVILICVSTLWRRLRRWRLVVGLACGAFVLALVVNPPYLYPLEENLAYRDFVVAQTRAAEFLEKNYPNARVLTAWPTSDALEAPYLGYVDRPFTVVRVDGFSPAQLAGAMNRREADVVLLFSTSGHGEQLAREVVSQFGGSIVYSQARRDQFFAVIDEGRADR